MATIESSYGDGGKTLTTTTQRNPNLSKNNDLLRALTTDRKVDYQTRRLFRDKEVHERALPSGDNQARALSGPVASYPARPRKERHAAPPPKAQANTEPQGMTLPIRSNNSQYSLANWGSGYTTDPIAIERGYILV